MAFTVTVVGNTGNTFPDVSLAVLVLTGATAAGGANLQVSAANGTFTPTFSNSRIVGVNGDDTTGGGLTLESNETNYNHGNDATNTFSASEWYYTGTVTAGVGFTVGATTSGTPVLAAYEVKASSGSTPLIDASSPAGVNNMTGSGSTTLTTASFSPPNGSVLVAMFTGNATGSGAVQATISDSSGLGLTWTLRATESPGSGPPGAFIWTTTMPGSPVTPALGPDRALPGPAWRGQFSKTAAKQQPPVEYDYNSTILFTKAAPAFAPDRALPGPAFRGQFSKTAAKSQPSVEYDYNPAFSAFVNATVITAQAFVQDVAAGTVVTITVNQNAILGQATIEDVSQGTQVLTETTPYNPQNALPGPAWRGQFSVHSQHEQPPVLFDYNPAISAFVRPTAIVGQAFVQDVSAGSIVTITATPSAVFAQATVEDVSNGTVISAGSVTVVAAYDPDIAMPGPAWRNQFGRLTKHAVLTDGNPAISAFVSAVAVAGQAFVQDVSAGTIVTITATPSAIFGQATVEDVSNGTQVLAESSPYNPPRAVIAPAIENQFFGKLSKNAVFFDGNPAISAFVSATAVAGQAFVQDVSAGTIITITATPSAIFSQAVVEDVSNGTQVLTETSPYNPQLSMPGPAWRNFFGHLTKYAVLADGNPDISAFVSAVAVFAQATIPAPVITITATPSAILAQAFVEDVSQGTQVLTETTPYNPPLAQPGQAWRNFFGHLTKLNVLFDGNPDISAFVSATAVAGQAFVQDVSQGTFVTITATPSAILGQATVEDVSNGTQVLVESSPYNPPQAQASRAWLNQFGHLTKYAVLYDVPAIAAVITSVSPAAIAGQAFVQDVSAGTIVTITVTPSAILGQATVEDVSNGTLILIGRNDPQSALPGSAWRNYFRAYLSKQSVAFDYNPDISAFVSGVVIVAQATIPTPTVSITATPTAIVAQATIEDVSNGTLIMIGTNDPVVTQFSGPWKNFFGHLTKYAVLFDGNPDISAFVSATAIAAQAFIEDVSNNTVVDVTVTPTAIAAQAVVEDVSNGTTIQATSAAFTSNDPDRAMPGPAWKAAFWHMTRPMVMSDYEVFTPVNPADIIAQAFIPAPVITIGVTPNVVSAQATIDDVSNGTVLVMGVTPTAITATGIIESEYVPVGNAGLSGIATILAPAISIPLILGPFVVQSATTIPLPFISAQAFTGPEPLYSQYLQGFATCVTLYDAYSSRVEPPE